jgi:subtilisin family serine protease
MNNNRYKVKIVTVSVLAALLIAALPFDPKFESSAIAQAIYNNPKLSDDLEYGQWRGEESSRGVTRASVIIQTPGTATTSLLSAITNVGGKVKKKYVSMYMLSATLPGSAFHTIADRDDVIYISYDRRTKGKGHLQTTTGADLVRNYGNAATGAITGAGIGIAILDSGIYAAHHSFGSRVVASVDFTGENKLGQDPYGHGTHVAAIAAGNDHVAYGAYTGVAPQAKLFNVRVLNSSGEGRTADAISGIDWCIANKSVNGNNIRVLNLSFGATAVDTYATDALCKAVRRAVDAGLVVCVAAGNMGKDASGQTIYGAIHSPGIEPSAITVGAANTYGTDTRVDDTVTTYSSRGPTRGYYVDSAGVKRYDNLIKPDIIAPGNKLIEAGSPSSYLDEAYPQNDASGSGLYPDTYHEMVYMSGSSMATPAVAGAAALVLQRNPYLTPNLVKATLQYTADPLSGYSNLDQGAGLLNVEGAVRLAASIRTDLTGRHLGDSLLAGPLPAQTSTVAGVAFPWGGGIIQKWNFIYGSALIMKYQGIYGTGVLLTDGVKVGPDGMLLADGMLLSQGMLLADGTMLSEGTLLSSGSLLTNGMLLSDGVTLTDMCTLLAEGSLLSDSFVSQDAMAVTQAANVIGNGDPSVSMSAVYDNTVETGKK